MHKYAHGWGGSSLGQGAREGVFVLIVQVVLHFMGYHKPFHTSVLQYSDCLNLVYFLLMQILICSGLTDDGANLTLTIELIHW